MSSEYTNTLSGIFKELYMPGYDPYIEELEEVTLSSLKEQLCLKP